MNGKEFEQFQSLPYSLTENPEKQLSKDALVFLDQVFGGGGGSFAKKELERLTQFVDENESLPVTDLCILQNENGKLLRRNNPSPVSVVAEIAYFAVLLTSRRKGLGRAIFNSLLENIRAVKPVDIISFTVVDAFPDQMEKGHRLFDSWKDFTHNFPNSSFSWSVDEKTLEADFGLLPKPGKRWRPSSIPKSARPPLD